MGAKRVIWRWMGKAGTEIEMKDGDEERWGVREQSKGKLGMIYGRKGQGHNEERLSGGIKGSRRMREEARKTGKEKADGGG